MKSKFTFIGTNKDSNMEFMANMSPIDAMTTVKSTIDLQRPWMDFGSEKARTFINLNNYCAVQVSGVEDENIG